VFKHQTHEDLASEYSKSISWIQQQIYSYKVAEKTHNPRAINLVCDTTFYGKRKDHLGTVVFYDAIEHEVILWKHVESEKSQYYKQLLNELLILGYSINAVALDGRRGLNTVFKAYPIQMCHFHQKQIVQRYTTKNPKSEAGKDLQKVMYALTKSSEECFKNKLQNWRSKHETYLSEMTVNKETRRSTYTHQKLRSGYSSLASNLEYLFTYNRLKEFNIPNTTNHLDGGLFSDLKNRIRVHRGLSRANKKKMVDYYMLNSGKKNTKIDPRFYL